VREIFVTALLLAINAWGQSPELIDAVRVHRSTALDTARAELSACLVSAGADGKASACPDAARLSLLSGYLMLSGGDAASAVVQLSSRAAPKGLEAFHAWYLGEALAWSGERTAALRSFKAVASGTPWLKKKVELRTAELLLAEGKPAQALALFDAAGDPSPEILYQRGLARTQSGQREKGRADLKTLLVHFPAHPHAQLARNRLEANGKPVTFTVDERFAREVGFLAAADPKSAGAELDAIVIPAGKKASAVTAQLALARANVLFAQGQEQDALAQLQGALAGPSSIAAEAMMLRARKLMRAGENQTARELLLGIDQKYTGEAPADDAGYLAAWIAMQAGDFAAAAKDFATFEQRHPASKKRDEARWFRAYSQLRQDDWAQARTTLQSLLTDFSRSSLVPQAKYWAARCTQLGHKPDAGAAPVSLAAEYRELVVSWPGSFYALLAQERLRELGLEVPPTFTDEPALAEVGPAPDELKLAIELAKTGLLRDAWEEVQTRISQVGSAPDALRFGRALQQFGEFGGAHTLAARFLWGAVYTQRSAEAVALMYPRAYRDSVERLCKEHGLDPFLAWAIMRRESAFKPEVSSIADARGLMQLIPPTARSIAKVLKIAAPEPDELYSPEANIGLGTWYLSALMDRFSHPALCAAAYNAGAAPVVKWALARAELPLDMWVEEIPYKETRGYVKQVTADYFIYQALYGEKSAPPKRLVLSVPAPRPDGVSF
jgi:soluble lytic murein transglycosylase